MPLEIRVEHSDEGLRVAPRKRIVYRMSSFDRFHIYYSRTFNLQRKLSKACISESTNDQLAVSDASARNDDRPQPPICRSSTQRDGTLGFLRWLWWASLRSATLSWCESSP